MTKTVHLAHFTTELKIYHFLYLSLHSNSVTLVIVTVCVAHKPITWLGSPRHASREFRDEGAGTVRFGSYWFEACRTKIFLPHARDVMNITSS